MSDVVFLLGAGASVEAGAPLMANFLDVAEDLRRGSQVPNQDIVHFDAVLEGIAALKAVQAQVTLDTYNLENTFSAFEMAVRLGRLGPIVDAQKLAALPLAMRRVIAATLENTMLLPFQQPFGGHGKWVIFESFTASLAGMCRPEWTKTAKFPSIITLNYDVGQEWSLYQQGHRYSYCVDFKPGDSLPQNELAYLKLHGSLNWSVCEQCQKVHHLPMHMVATGLQQYSHLYHQRDCPLHVTQYLSSLQCCGKSLSTTPFIVPPTWNKAEQRSMSGPWAAAAQALSQARYLVVMGYSFPETDLYMKYLLALGLSGQSRIRKIFLVDPSSAVHDRMKKMLSPALLPRLEWLNENFSRAAGTILPRF